MYRTSLRRASGVRESAAQFGPYGHSTDVSNRRGARDWGRRRRRWHHGVVSRPDRVIFRLPGVSLLIPFLFFICVTPLANAGPGWLLALYALPVVGLVYILITRTVADVAAISTTGLLGRRRIAWADLDGLEFRGPRWAVALAQDGRRVRLPMVRPRDLPRLAQVSGGRLLLAPQSPGTGSGVDDPATGTRQQPDPTESAAPAHATARDE